MPALVDTMPQEENFHCLCQYVALTYEYFEYIKQLISLKVHVHQSLSFEGEKMKLILKKSTSFIEHWNVFFFLIHFIFTIGLLQVKYLLLAGEDASFFSSNGLVKVFDIDKWFTSFTTHG